MRATTRPTWICGLQELRGLAIALVLCCYLLVGVRWQSGPFRTGWQDLFGLGATGVDLFFVLSGFLITGILLDSRGRPNRLTDFFRSRLLRIGPLYYLLLAASLLLANTLPGAVLGWRQLGHRTAVWYWMFLGNVPLVTGIGKDNSLNVAWSLAVEEQFYIVWPLIAYAMPRRSLGWLCAAILVLSPAIRWAAQTCGLSAYACHFCTPCHMDGLAAGALLSVLYRSTFWTWLTRHAVMLAIGGALPVVVLVATVRHPMPQIVPGWPSIWSTTVFSIGYASLLLLVLAPTTLQLRSAALRSFGKYSYAIYLLHPAVHGALDQVVQKYAASTAGRFRPQTDLFLALVTVPLTFGFSWVSWRWIESPCLRLKSRLQSQVDAANDATRPDVIRKLSAPS